MNNNGNGNLWLAIALSVVVLVGYHYAVERPRLEAVKVEQQRAIEAAKTPTVVADIALADSKPRAELVAGAGRIKVQTPRLHGSIALRGARIDDLTLADYKVSPASDVEPMRGNYLDEAKLKGATNAEVVLFSPAGTAAPDHGYFAEFGWLGSDVKTPGASTVWQTNSRTLTPETPVVLAWNNGAGLVFTRTIAVDDNYMFTITDSVRNAGAAATLYPYSVISRHADPKIEDLFILHEGPLGVFDGTLTEVDYKDLRDDGTVEKHSATGGWLGMTDKYWLAALVTEKDKAFTGRMQYGTQGNGIRFQVDTRGDAVTVPTGGSIEHTQRLFAGAKEVKLLDKYEETLGIPNFDLAVDFGWFYFLTKPFFYAIDGIAMYFKDTGYGFGIAIILFTILLRLVFFPLQNKSYIAMNRMKKLQPKLMELRERYKDDKQQQSMKMFELYREEKVNPMAGCWPILLQIPVFFALYKVLYVTIEMRHAPFWGWINDLSAPDPTSVFNLFGLLPYDVPSFLVLGAWPLMMGVTMYLQQKLSPASPDPVQAAMFKWMPVIFTIMLAHFPAGLVIYWTWSNALAIAQQYYLLKRHK